MGPLLYKWLDKQPQGMLWEVQRDRKALPSSDPQQQKLALEDRRAFSRDLMQDNIPMGVFNAVVAAPAEQVAKAAIAAPGVGPYAEKMLRSIGLYGGSRSGYFEPMANIGASMTGALQGLDDRGLFGRGKR